MDENRIEDTEIDLRDRLMFAAGSLAADFGEELSVDLAEALVFSSAQGLLVSASVTDPPSPPPGPRFPFPARWSRSRGRRCLRRGRRSPLPVRHRSSPHLRRPYRSPRLVLPRPSPRLVLPRRTAWHRCWPSPRAT